MATPRNNSVLRAFAILRAFDERSREIAHKLFRADAGAVSQARESVRAV